MSDPAWHSGRMRTLSACPTEPKLDEIDGYLELGMEEEALDLVGSSLTRSELSADQFHSCILALLQSREPEPWRSAVESAYRRLSKPATDQAQSAMLNYYFSIGDYARAFEFFPRQSTKFFDAWTMMQVCLELGRLDEAKKVARYCRGLLATDDDDFTKASMADALGAFYLRIADPEKALQVWQDAPTEPTFHRQRLTGLVKARLLQALQTAKNGRASLAREKQKPDLSCELSLPGNAAQLMNDTEGELSELESAIQQLIPKVAEAKGDRAVKT
jgi:tetratricopeptide (TPR) repeat protein